MSTQTSVGRCWYRASMSALGSPKRWHSSPALATALLATDSVGGARTYATADTSIKMPRIPSRHRGFFWTRDAKVNEGTRGWSRVCVSRGHVLGETGASVDETRSARRHLGPGQHRADASPHAMMRRARARGPEWGARRAFMVEVARRSQNARLKILARRSHTVPAPEDHLDPGRQHTGALRRSSVGRCLQGWRRRWDSNPRKPYNFAGFQVRCLQPLDHSPLARAPARSMRQSCRRRQASRRASPRGGRGDDEWRGALSHLRAPARRSRCRCCGPRRCCRRPRRSDPAA